jgi:hypothetical protein
LDNVIVECGAVFDLNATMRLKEPHRVSSFLAVGKVARLVICGVLIERGRPIQVIKPINLTEAEHMALQAIADQALVTLPSRKGPRQRRASS